MTREVIQDEETKEKHNMARAGKMTNQGRNGQWRFASLCTGPDVSTDAVVNVAVDDQHGWDNILEIIPPQNNTLPADLRIPVIACFTQIKTTRGKKIQTTVKLSNAVKAAKSPLPSFVFLFHYTSSGEPKLYGKHIWKDEIRHYLKRARQAGTAPLNKKSVTIKFSASDRLTCNPIDWVLAVLSNCGGRTYTVEKNTFVENVGYETQTHTGNFELGPLNSQADIVLHELGVVKDLPVANFKVYDTRFGIKAPTPLELLSEGRISFSKAGRAVTVKLRSIKGNTIAVPGLAWAPSIVPLDHPEFRIRVKAGFIDIVSRPSDIKAGLSSCLDVNFDLRKDLPFIEQLGLLALINWTAIGKVTASVEIDQGQLFSATVNLDAPVDEWIKNCWTSGQYFLEILGSERCASVGISLLDFHGFMQEYFTMAALHETNDIRFEGLFGDELDSFSKLVGYSYGQFGDWTFGAIHEFNVLSQSQVGEKLILKLAKPQIVEKFVFTRPLEQAIEHIRGEFQEYLERRTASVAVFEDGDLFEWGRVYRSNGSVAIHVHNAIEN